LMSLAGLSLSPAPTPNLMGVCHEIVFQSFISFCFLY
jgi:hypothetical protein